MEISVVEKWLAPSLNYDPDKPAPAASAAKLSATEGKVSSSPCGCGLVHA
jgi:hypothetical protein